MPNQVPFGTPEGTDPLYCIYQEEAVARTLLLLTYLVIPVLFVLPLSWTVNYTMNMREDMSASLRADT